MSLKRIAVAMAALWMMGTIGCAATPYLDSNWGRSFETAKYNQTLNPEAGRPSLPQK